MKLLATLLVLGITKHLQLKYDSSFEKIDLDKDFNQRGKGDNRLQFITLVPKDFLTFFLFVS